MVGQLRFPFRERTATAILNEDGMWHCAEVPSLVRVLDAFYSPRRDGLPVDGGQLSRRHLHAAARWLKGTVEGDPTAVRN